MKGLHIHGVSHAYGNNKVLNNVSLTIPTGELVCLLGPSGCGKSTLLRLAAGLETLQCGTIVIDDQTVATKESSLAPEHRHIGLMFQDYALFPHLDIVANVCFGLIGMARDKARARALEMLDQVGMADYAKVYPHTLSGGQQQRIALARALAPEPKLLLLDEPFSGLDTNMRQMIREDTLNVLKQNGVATLMVTHDPEEAMFMADRIKILGRHGRVRQSGSPHDIYYKPNDEFVAGLFGLMNRLGGVVRDGAVETPLGRVGAGGIADGTAVQVLIRPEGIVLSGGNTGSNPGIPVSVSSTHLLGHSSIVSVSPDGNSGDEYFARVHREFSPELEDTIFASIEASDTFVFPLKEDTASAAPIGMAAE
ncbi:MAG: ABC transporter ATP-binding protein [Rhodospirillales bacterium]|nr:ABC transporter ATP-binding protein [Rhodospirillales bacterium]